MDQAGQKSAVLGAKTIHASTSKPAAFVHFPDMKVFAMNEIPNLNSGRSSIIKRPFRWLFSRRIMRRVLIGIAVMITLIAVIYLRVNFHGKQEWENTKREMAANGEVWDWSAFAPTPVPDDQNIFKAPKMAEWFGDKRNLFDKPLDERMTNEFARRFFNTNSTAEIKTAQAAASYLAWSDQFLDDFNTIGAALKRPYARMVADYSQPFSITLPNAATVYAVVKTLVQRAKCHLILGQPNKAWQELTLLHDLRRLVEDQGKFITTEGDWMRRELARHSLQVIAMGLELHAWQEPQLVALQEQLRNSDFLNLHAEALKCGRALLLGAMEDGDLNKALFMAGGDNFWTRLKKHPEFPILKLAPRGVMYERATSVSGNFRKMIRALTPADGIVRPADFSKAFNSWKRALEGLPLLLRTQTLVNEGQIACALERYRLAHGAYPETLGTLVPQFIEKLPSDIINGQPLIYRHTGDGTFLLYSVGWNETDDGGKVAMAEGGMTKMTEGDWVWKSYMY